MPSLDDATAQHVARTLRALELLAEGPQTQADVARGLEVHRRTARRLLGRLVNEGYARPTERGRFVAYAATPRLTVLGRKVADGLDLVAIGRQHLAALADGGPGIRFVAMLKRGAAVLVHVDEAEKGEGPAGEGRLARSGPLHATAAGKVFLSADDALVAEVLNQDLIGFTAKTLVARADLLLELARVRAQGYAAEDEEHRSGERAVASGVVDHTGRTVAALGATPAAGVELADLGLAVREAAKAFSKEIGAAVE